MKGRKPLPTALHLLNGNPGKRKLPETVEDRFSGGEIEPPEVLGKDAREEWDRIVPLLNEAGILKKIDRTALAAYCLCYGRWLEAEEKVKTGGWIVRTPTGHFVTSPYIRMIEKCLEQMKSFMADFGMTPASRVRIKPGSPEDNGDELDQWLNGKRQA